MSERESSKKIRLTVEGGPTREFPGDRAFVIGRSQHADFSIPHPNLSREHVRISLKGAEVWLEDLGSANGTFVQGQRLPARSSVKIKPHYRVLLGSGSDVVVSFEAVEIEESLQIAKPKGDVDLSVGENPSTRLSMRSVTASPVREDTPAPTRNDRSVPSIPREGTRTSMTRSRIGAKVELDYPQGQFPHEAKKEKHAELRIIEAKKQRVLEDIQYKEREVADLRRSIRDLKEESVSMREELEEFKRQVQPLTDHKAELEHRIEELEVIYQEKIDSLESGFLDLKLTHEESHAERMADAEREFREKSRRVEEEYSLKLQELDLETRQIRQDAERLRDRMLEEKGGYEEALEKIQKEREELEAGHRLSKVRIETEIAELQGAKTKLDNEIERERRENESLKEEIVRLNRSIEDEKSRLEEVKGGVERARLEEEAFKKSIEEIKASEEKNLKRIEELKSQVAILESKAAGIELSLKQAEIDADAIRREGQKSAEQYRVSVQEQIEAERQSMRDQIDAEMKARERSAEEKEAQLLAQAAERAAAIETASREAAERSAIEANAHGERIRSEAEGYSTRVRGEADEYASQVRGNADNEVARVIEENAAQSERLKVESAAEAERLVSEAKENAERSVSEANAHSERVIAEANSYSERKEAEANSRIEKMMADANAQASSNRRALEQELSEMKKRVEHEVRQIRANAINDIETTRERESKEFETKLNRRVREIGDQVERIVGSRLVNQFGVSMDPPQLKEFSDEIHHIVEKVIGTSKTGANPDITLKNVLAVNSDAQNRAIRYWKKMGVAASVVLALIVTKIAAPQFYTAIGTKLAETFAIKDNTDQVVKRMLRERQLAMTFVTDQDRDFRDNYSDNILYSEGFIDMKEDSETQKVWTLSLNQFFQKELGLTEKAIVQFGSAEGRLLRELIELRKNIIPARSEAGIDKMREVEGPILKEMKFIVRTDANWKRFEGFHKNFYDKYLETLFEMNRAPASKD